MGTFTYIEIDSTDFKTQGIPMIEFKFYLILKGGAI
jgi:hypothetical protein